MTKLHVLFLTLIFCSSAFAEQIVLICERPAWEGEEGCGPNNTYETYRFFVDTDDFDKKGGASCGYQRVKGCDLSKAPKQVRSKYAVSEDAFLFHDRSISPWRTIRVDRESLEAVLSVEATRSPNLKCHEVEVSPEEWSKY